MANFEELQQIWQQQRGAGFTRLDAASLTGAFRRYGRRNDVINVCKVLVIATQLYFIVTVFRHRPITLFGACLVDFSALFFMLCDWRNQRAIAQLNFASPSTAFVRRAIERLKQQRDPFRTRDFLIALTGFWTGSLVILADRWSRSQHPWLFAFVMLCMPFPGFAFGRWIRRTRFRRECQPLLERLEALLVTMSESTETHL